MGNKMLNRMLAYSRHKAKYGQTAIGLIAQIRCGGTLGVGGGGITGIVENLDLLENEVYRMIQINGKLETELSEAKARLEE